MLDRINEAIEIDRRARESSPVSDSFSRAVSRLTSREREVMDLLVQGRSLKQISIEFGISFQTVSKHRARVLEKLQVGNDVELVRRCLGCDEPCD
nr:LuxR C-terminal-related transcriptional regulator [Rhodopirellula sp. JC639]